MWLAIKAAFIYSCEILSLFQLDFWRGLESAEIALLEASVSLEIKEFTLPTKVLFRMSYLIIQRTVAPQ